LGIGTSIPSQALDVTGNIKSSGSIDAGTQFLGFSTDTVSAPSFSWTGDATTGMWRSGAGSIASLSREKQMLTPMIVYSAQDFSQEQAAHIQNQTHGLIIQKDSDSIERLLEEVIGQLHVNHKDLSEEKKKRIENIRHKRDILNDRSILVVDDDVRNLFALTTVFERYKMNVATAESGQEAIDILSRNPRIEMVLMDIMMPEMDGYETTQKIRREHQNSSLPIIAVTAKAMKGDRQKCLEAGASDYITKPLKIDQLLSLMRLWFYK
jgi:CheY-like chemotaxis protein